MKLSITMANIDINEYLSRKKTNYLPLLQQRYMLRLYQFHIYQTPVSENLYLKIICKLLKTKIYPNKYSPKNISPPEVIYAYSKNK